MTLLLRLLHCNNAGAVEMDLFLRQCLRQFPFLQSALLKQLVATLAKVEPVSITVHAVVMIMADVILDFCI